MIGKLYVGFFTKTDIAPDKFYIIIIIILNSQAQSCT